MDFVLIIIALTIIITPTFASDDGCNEYVCGSVVSKCLLTQSCQCKLNDCFCCKDCLNCLGDLYTECCGCLDMCPTHNSTLGALTPRSEIGDIDGVPELFETLTAEDADDQWTTISFPMRSSLKQQFGGIDDIGDDIGDDIDQEAALQKNTGSVNCTVIFLNSCVRSIKCQQHCESMGANSYRWFHDGCCECVGAYCINYGINESRCSACPEEEPDAALRAEMGDDETEDEMNFDAEQPINEHDMWDYPEDEMGYN